MHDWRRVRVYLFITDENGEPTAKPFDNGGYLDVYPHDRGENIRREIAYAWRNEVKPKRRITSADGQNEVDFKFSDAVNNADNLITFKQVVKHCRKKRAVCFFCTETAARQKRKRAHVNVLRTDITYSGWVMVKRNTQ